tara:strand:- start:149 stop:358 length:210 start_codon:yes stop_codon:yes gene_type:complete
MELVWWYGRESVFEFTDADGSADGSTQTLNPVLVTEPSVLNSILSPGWTDTFVGPLTPQYFVFFTFNQS